MMRKAQAWLSLVILLGPRLAAAQDIVIFDDDDAIGTGYYDASWGTATQSYLELVGPGRDKMPINSVQKYRGQHSGILRWKQVSGGLWRLFIAADGWVGQNAVGYDSLVFYLNGPQAFSGSVLPFLGLEDTDNQLSDTTALSDHFSGLDADVSTWQRVQVPLSAFQPFGPFDLNKLKTVRFSQGVVTADTVTLWVDEIRVVRKKSDTQAPTSPQNVAAIIHDGLVELNWDDNAEADLAGYTVYRATNAVGPYSPLNSELLHASYHFDPTVVNGTLYYYKVTAVDSSSNESEPSGVVSAMPMKMPLEDLLDLEQRAAFYFFWYGSNPTTGVSLDRMTNPTLGATGSTGFALTTYPIAVERGWITREQAAARVVKVLRFYRDRADQFHGLFPHFLNSVTGKVIELFSRDNGVDVVESAYFFAGALTCRQYFNRDEPLENEIRQIATELYHAADWQFMRRNDRGDTLQTISWHWSPTYGFSGFGLRVTGYNEAMIVYLLALGSPTHPVPASTYPQGWASTYKFNRSYFGIPLPVESWSSSLFTYQYTHCWIDYRNRRDAYADYFENSRNATLINRQYCISRSATYGYSDSLWGLTASDGPGFAPYRGYEARGPFQFDDGTVAPTAALSSMPFTPEESFAVLEYLRNRYRDRLWGPYGFKDAFNVTANWFDPDYIGIDQGPIVIMIENYRTGLVWQLFMSNPEVQQAMMKAGFVPTSVTERSGSQPTGPKEYFLAQSYPNPFSATGGSAFGGNPEIEIVFHLPRIEQVTLTVYNMLGQKVRLLVDEVHAPGKYTVRWDGRDDHGREVSGGVYFYRLETAGYQSVRKTILLR